MSGRIQKRKKYTPKFVIEKDKQQNLKKSNPCISFAVSNFYCHASDVKTTRKMNYGFLYCFDKVCIEYAGSKIDRARYLRKKMIKSKELYDKTQHEDSYQMRQRRKRQGNVLALQGQGNLRNVKKFQVLTKQRGEKVYTKQPIQKSKCFTRNQWFRCKAESNALIFEWKKNYRNILKWLHWLT